MKFLLQRYYAIAFNATMKKSIRFVVSRVKVYKNVRNVLQAILYFIAESYFIARNIQ